MNLTYGYSVYVYIKKERLLLLLLFHFYSKAASSSLVLVKRVADAKVVKYARVKCQTGSSVQGKCVYTDDMRDAIYNTLPTLPCLTK